MARWTDEGAPDPDMDFLTIGSRTASDRAFMLAVIVVAVLGMAGSAALTLWLVWHLMVTVAPLVPWAAALLIQTGGTVVAGWL